MASPLTVYSRPQDDSSDDEQQPNDPNQVTLSDDQSDFKSTATINMDSSNSIVPPVSPPDPDHIHSDSVQRGVPIPALSGGGRMRSGQGFAASVNFSIFAERGSECQSGHRVVVRGGGGSVGGGIVSRCDSLRRLVEGLKCFEAMKEDQVSMIEFVENQYREQMMDDFNHFVAEHEQQSIEILNELIISGQFKACEVEHCVNTKRHFDESHRFRESKAAQFGDDDASKMMAFYAAKYDAAHFALFHLFETGYRVPPRPQTHDDDDDDDDDEKAIQQELAEAVSAISAGRDRCKDAFARFKVENNNKFNLSVDVEAESKTEDGHSVNTKRDSMMQYAARNGVAHGVLFKMNGFMVAQDVDTDAAKDDVADSKEESNLFAATKDHDAFQAVNRYFRASAGTESACPFIDALL